MSNKTDAPITLGDKLNPQRASSPQKSLGISFGKSIFALLVSATLSTSFWWATNSPLAGIAVLIICRLFFGQLLFARQPLEQKQAAHFLLQADRERFMKSLKLLDKTAIFDGNNIYHFGLDHRLGTRALKILVQHLRADGHRIVCFFDANIYYTLRDHGDLETDGRFSIKILNSAFDLNPDEIYIVPSGTQADKFIVETLMHLRRAFAVTNDRFRDHKRQYRFLVKSDWRKGVEMNGTSLQLYKYRFKKSLKP